MGAVAFGLAMEELGGRLGHHRGPRGRLAPRLRGVAGHRRRHVLGPGPVRRGRPARRGHVHRGRHAPALVAARLSAEFGVGVRHGCFCAHPYLIRLLGVGPAGSPRRGPPCSAATAAEFPERCGPAAASARRRRRRRAAPRAARPRGRRAAPGALRAGRRDRRLLAGGRRRRLERDRPPGGRRLRAVLRAPVRRRWLLLLRSCRWPPPWRHAPHRPTPRPWAAWPGSRRAPRSPCPARP